MTSGHDVSEYLGTLGLVKSYFFNIFGKKNREKKYLGAPTPPEDEAISLFAGLLANPDMVLSQTYRQSIQTTPRQFTVIENFLSHHEESGLQRTIIFRALHTANRCLMLMFTTD